MRSVDNNGLGTWEAVAVEPDGTASRVVSVFRRRRPVQEERQGSQGARDGDVEQVPILPGPVPFVRAASEQVVVVDDDVRVLGALGAVDGGQRQDAALVVQQRRGRTDAFFFGGSRRPSALREADERRRPGIPTGSLESQKNVEHADDDRVGGSPPLTGGVGGARVQLRVRRRRVAQRVVQIRPQGVRHPPDAPRGAIRRVLVQIEHEVDQNAVAPGEEEDVPVVALHAPQHERPRAGRRAQGDAARGRVRTGPDERIEVGGRQGSRR
jgi:hypothetical protein